MRLEEIIKELKKMANPKNVVGMARFGLFSKKTVILGIKKPVMDKMAKAIGKDTKLALRLWKSKIYEARVLAALIADPVAMTDKQVNKWIFDFDNWGVCDNACMNLFHKLPNAYKKVKELVARPEEFVRRTGFAMIASLSVHDKKASDKEFIKFLPIIKKYSIDERNYVRKAVNWALRQIGKRNKVLNKEAIRVSREILKIDSKSARWIANDALRELSGAAIQKRLK